MQIPFVDLQAQYRSIKTEIDQAIAQVISETAFISGKFARKFEAEFAEWQGIDHCVVCANGTDALEIMYKALELQPGDEVLVPALTWISTAGAVSGMGGEPVFVDVDPHTYTMDLDDLERKIGPKTKGIVPVHLYGLAVNMDRVMEIANKHGLWVVEDCAQAHGATWKGQKVGTFGHGATFSFYPGKNLGAYGDAGCMVTKDESLARELKMITNHGQPSKHDHQRLGRNSRLDGIQAAILSVKLPHLDSWTALRQQWAARYNELLADMPFLLPKVPDGATHVYHLYVVQCEDREHLRERLKAKGISTGIHYPTPLPFVPAYAYKGHSVNEFPQINAVSPKILSLPIFPEMSEAQIGYVRDSLNEVLMGSLN